MALPGPNRPRVALVTNNRSGFEEEVFRGALDFARRHGRWEMRLILSPPARVRSLTVVATTDALIRELVSRGRDGTPIAIRLDDARPERPPLVELAKQRDWRLFNLGITVGVVPSDIEFKGAIVNDLPTAPVVRQLLDRKVPTVRIGALPHPDDRLAPAVMPDRIAAGSLAAEHFAERQFKHVAFVGRKPWADNEPVYEAYAERAAELGCQCYALQESVSAIRRQAESDEQIVTLRREAFWRWLDETPSPLGLFTFGDAAAALYCHWVLQGERRVPEDVAILGMSNNVFICEGAAMELSSVSFNPVHLAATAVNALERLMTGEELEQTTIRVLPTGVVTRQSTDVLAASDPNVVAALRFMWDNVTQDLAVDHIARHVGVSRRTLEKAFRRELRRGINEEFQRRRLEKARELITHTDLRVGDVAQALSFSSDREFCRVFRETFGRPPGQYRKQTRPDG